VGVRALVTGIAGFVGSHLADHLVASGLEVHGTAHPEHGKRNLTALEGRVTLHLVDLRSYPAVREVLEATQPEWLVHLAARASVERAWLDPEATLVDNTLMQLNVLRAVHELELATRILVVGSADEYGLVSPDELPIDEDTPLRPLNPYAVSKVAQDYLGYQYHLGRGLDVVRVRPFNQIGPRQSTGFVVPDFASQVARIEAGLSEPLLRVGNLSARRDLTDVRDMVRAYRLALERCEAGCVYNIGAERSYGISEVLETLLELANVSVRVERDPARMRPSDVPNMVCDCRRFRGATGWEPQYTLEQSLRDVLEEWRERVRQER